MVLDASNTNNYVRAPGLTSLVNGAFTGNVPPLSGYILFYVTTPDSEHSAVYIGICNPMQSNKLILTPLKEDPDITCTAGNAAYTVTVSDTLKQQYQFIFMAFFVGGA